MVRDSLRALLEAYDFTIFDFGSCRDFLNRRANVTAACLIVDIHMPHMTGLDLLRMLRKNSDPIPVILITGLRDTTTKSQAEALGVVALLDKPLAHTALLAAIERALASPRH
ncbi:MAG: response regulator [Proteobacteria bacterium]|nr:response regulator [Pseudomonadota bacterium]